MERLTRKSDGGMVWFIDHEHKEPIEREPCDMGAHHARLAIAKLAEYEDLGLEPSEIKPYIELAEKMNLCDLVRGNKRISEKIMFLEAQLRKSDVETYGDWYGKGNMERLTSYESVCKREMICRYEDCDTCEEYCPNLNEDNCPCLQEILEKLAKYEDLEEQGKLVKLPCAVGDTLYTLNSLPSGKKIIGKTIADAFMITLGVLEGRFGKTMFTTPEAAKAALKELFGDTE